MRLRELFLYKASDILLGDHLHEKFATVQWIGADMPHIIGKMLNNHFELKALALGRSRCFDHLEDIQTK